MAGDHPGGARPPKIGHSRGGGPVEWNEPSYQGDLAWVHDVPRSRPRTALYLLGVTVVASGGAFAWWSTSRSAVPEGFALANGRLEGTQIHVATKLPGRVAELLVREGDEVKEGQALARMDAATLDAQLARAEAVVAETQAGRDAAEAGLAQRMSECTLAHQELGRTEQLFERDVSSARALDVERSRAETAHSVCSAARAQVASAGAGVEGARADVARIQAELSDTVLVAPRSGRIQYRLVEPGEVLAAGGRVFTLLDRSDMYMTVFLPAQEAGRIRIGAEARVVLDALPGSPLPARVTYVSEEAQFTPKQVETSSERQKLSFRVKARLVDSSADVLKPGSPGIVWLRLEDRAAWPASLR